jgi:replicative DNA helicase
MTKAKSEDKQKKCLFLIAEKGKWAVTEPLKPLKPVYNGVGWFIEEKYRNIAEQISQQAEMRLEEWPLNEHKTFEELRRTNRRGFLSEKAIKIRFQIDRLKASLELQDISTPDLLQDEHRMSLEKIPEGRQLLKHLKEYDHLQEQIKHAEDEEKISNIKTIAIPIVPIKTRIDSHNASLEKYRGKKHLGLCVKTITELNDKMLGLRKLILLAAAPNVGKTALTIQLAVEVLLTEPSACLVYVSLEMDAEEIFTRMNLYLSELDFDTYVLGSQQVEGETGFQNFFSQEELRKIESATSGIEQLGDRLQIIDLASCADLTADLTADTIIDYVERLKSSTGCTRAIVVIDYLQVWPIPQGLRLTSDLEADKWRIGEVKRVKEALNTVNQDPVIVISEARKPSDSTNTWGGDLSDVMGSARGTYTPDAVLLLIPLTDKQLKELWDKMKMPPITHKEDVNNLDDGKDNTKGFLAHHGISICSLKMPKGRDGMKRFNILLAFDFYKNRFDKINWAELRTLAGKNSSRG